MDNQIDVVKRNKNTIYVAVFIFIVFTVCYFYLSRIPVDSSLALRQLWGGTYTVMALYGGVVGIFISRRWGGYKSLVGRAILFLSIGLVCQTFGQLANSIYNVFLHVEVPYPSLGDVGFFGAVLTYIYSAYLLCKMSGAKFSLKSVHKKIWAIIIPLAILAFSYFLFLKGYEFDWTNKLKVFLDFGYPLGQAIYLSFAILALLISQQFLGGLMKKPISFLIVALLFDYAADFVFLYQVSHGTWVTGGINDYQYFASYFVMTLALIFMGTVLSRIKQS